AYITFPVENPAIALELKFIVYHKLFNDMWKLSTAFHTYSTELKRCIQFLNEEYPHLGSLLDIDIYKAEKEWLLWLSNKGIRTTYTQQSKHYGPYKSNTNVANQFRSFYENLLRLTDHREEWVKDKWDVRELNERYGINYNLS
ncbi:transposase, partial [Terribacillus saccharophilus]